MVRKGQNGLFQEDLLDGGGECFFVVDGPLPLGTFMSEG